MAYRPTRYSIYAVARKNDVEVYQKITEIGSGILKIRAEDVSLQTFG